MASDAHLVAWVRQGRTAAFEALYARHHRAILSFCHHMLGSLEEAEDAVQHTFLAAYNGLAASQRPIHLRAWLYTIARNRCCSMLRRRREQPLADVDEPASEGLATVVQRRQDLRDLVRDMHRLPDDQRAALVLAEMDALSHEQIGTVLGVPTPKVKALVFQARESLLASRSAREADCGEIREQLANLRGGALRRTELRRHLRECPGCRDFRRQVDRQRRQLRVLLPVAPTIALKHALLSAGGGSAAAGGVAGGGLLASSSLKGGTLIGAVLAGVGAAGAIVAVQGLPHVGATPSPRHVIVKQVPGGVVPSDRVSASTRGVTANGHLSSRAMGALTSLAFSPAYRLVRSVGHVRGDSSRLFVVSKNGARGRAHALTSTASGTSGSTTLSTGLSQAQQSLLASLPFALHGLTSGTSGASGSQSSSVAGLGSGFSSSASRSSTGYRTSRFSSHSGSYAHPFTQSSTSGSPSVALGGAQGATPWHHSGHGFSRGDHQSPSVAQGSSGPAASSSPVSSQWPGGAGSHGAGHSYGIGLSSSGHWRGASSGSGWSSHGGGRGWSHGGGHHR